MVKSVAEHLADGCGIKSTARLVKVDPSTVRQLNRKAGRHGQHYHEQEVHDVAVSELQADERHGFAGSKQQPTWEAELIDPASKFILAQVQIIKHYNGYRLKAVEICYVHGSKKRIEQALDRLGHNVPNTSAIERRNGTARLMSAAQVRKTLAFAKKG